MLTKSVDVYRSSPIPFSFHLTFHATIHFSSLFPYLRRHLQRGNIFPPFLEESTVPSPFFEKRINTPMAIFREVTSDRSILLKIKTDACAGTEYAVNYLEHVQAVISVNATRRGDLELFLTSPMGTR